jgi:ABC-type polysaccharide/polyol phosphate transport system ATPase subunit
LASNAVKFVDVHKRYRIYQERYRSLKEIVMHRRFGEWEDRWALSGVNLDIQHGETFGLIGPNGAGKSTSLKLMARILDPDRGQVRVDGRLSGLLELAAGFQPEYTGRENVYLNASLLGLSRRDIDARFDRIVEFAELEQYIDSPVRTYSSGMFMRLGFSVAINVEPEIMVVDEILAVGDEAFQTKCYAWLERFQSKGGTVVLVSHNLGQVRTVCSRVGWVMNGKLNFVGAPDEAVERYLEHVRDGSIAEAPLKMAAGPDGSERPAVELAQVSLRDQRGQPATDIRSGDALTVEIAYRVNRPVKTLVFGIAVHRSDGLYVYGTNTWVDGVPIAPLDRDGRLRLSYRKLELMKGQYRMTVAILESDGHQVEPSDQHWQDRHFRVVAGKEDEGVSRLDHTWELLDEQGSRRAMGDPAGG